MGGAFEYKVEQYIEEQLQEQDRIKINAAKRRDGGLVLPEK